MNWGYVAGYFDGEGHVAFHDNGRGKKTYGLTWTNTHRGSLEAIKDFMGCGNLSKGRPGSLGKKICYQLSVTRRADVLRVLDSMSPLLIVKLAQATEMRDYMLANVKDEHPNFGKVMALGAAGLRERYHGLGMSLKKIADELGVQASAVCFAMQVHGIERRPVGGAHLKGVPKSPETISRMKIAAQKRWSDPTQRTQQLRNLDRSRAGIAAANT